VVSGEGAAHRSTESTRRYPLPTFTYSAYDVAYTQFRQVHFGLPEDGAPAAPKHVGASWYFKYMVYFEKCISLGFLASYFENAWSKLQKKQNATTIHSVY
jgi:hypothetical protein